jgi:hypothetical protein
VTLNTANRIVMNSACSRTGVWNERSMNAAGASALVFVSSWT